MTENTQRRSIGAKRNPASAEAILDAAENLLAERGLRGFTIEEVARRARAGKPTIYKWWSSKAALLLDVYQRQKTIAFQDTGNLEDDIVAFITAITIHWRDTPAGAVFRSVIAEAQSDEKAGQALRRFSDERLSETSFLILRGLERGEIKNGIFPKHAARWISSYLWFRLLTGDLDVSQQNLRRDVSVLLLGLRKDEK
ncbi:MAG: TetR/AcrR family transcriptional regulator [Pseudomonadota bacterium]